MEDGSHAEAAGQEVEHEVARMAAPLIFAFNNDDSDGSISNKKLKMRIGWFSAKSKMLEHRCSLAEPLNFMAVLFLTCPKGHSHRLPAPATA